MKPNKILLIDDDSDFLTALKLRCQQIGLEVSQAHNLLTALASIEKNPPDLICLDVEMPTGNGLAFCDMLRKDFRTKAIPIAIVSGSQAPATRNACQRMGVHFVSKSGRFWAELEPVIKKMLGRSPQPQAEIDGHQQLLDAAFAILTSDPEDPKVNQLHSPDSDAGNTEPTPTILCIDDDSDFYEVLSRRFAEYGISVLHAKEGIEGYRTAFVSPICAILLDYNMPNGRGDYILSRLMDNPVTKDIPVIVLTGQSDKMLERKMLAMGAKAYFEKPFEFNKLKQALTAAISS